MAFKMRGFSPFDKEHGDGPTVGSVVGDIDNRVGDAASSGDMKALRKALNELNKDIKILEKAGKGEELREYINPSTYANVNTYMESYRKDNPQKEE